MSYAAQVSDIFGQLAIGLPQAREGLTVRSPIDGNAIAVLAPTAPARFEAA